MENYTTTGYTSVDGGSKHGQFCGTRSLVRSVRYSLQALSVALRGTYVVAAVCDAYVPSYGFDVRGLKW